MSMSHYQNEVHGDFGIRFIETSGNLRYRSFGVHVTDIYTLLMSSGSCSYARSNFERRLPLEEVNNAKSS